MKKTRFYPFERNHYFYGKLLTVRDFESEQTYFNNKRRMMNRLLFGTGVVTGLQVIAVDDKSISVEAGVALDHAGREIVVSSPLTLKLSMIDGFSNNEYMKNVYVCLAYDEKGKEPVHSVANSSVREEEISEYNRIMESYKLYIQEDAPDPSSFAMRGMMEDHQVLYQDSMIRVLQITPRYVNAGEVFELTVRIEKALQAPKIRLDYELDSPLFQPLQGAQAKVHFDEPGVGQETEYEVKLRLRAADQAGEKGSIAMLPDQAKLYLGERELFMEAPAANRIEIIQGSIVDRMMKDMQEKRFDQVIASNQDQHIYLAKVNLIQMGATYTIEGIEPVPFQQYVYNPTIAYQFSRKDRLSGSGTFLTKASVNMLPAHHQPEMEVKYRRELQQFEFDLGIPKPPKLEDDVATGTIDFQYEPDSKTGVPFFSKSSKSLISDEITHGFQGSEILIMTQLEIKEASHQPEHARCLYGGDLSVFKGSEYESELSQIDIGTLQYPDKGTFRIGVKLHKMSDPIHFQIRWWAVRKQAADKPFPLNNNRQEMEQAEQEAASGQEPDKPQS
ncbi:hypothetical protein [Marinicrinis sediminis]|uniref:DUF4139 domain-containing protein n=1 Tax=Marinicrinis sediminis TaxID=1652465 RepID=A0ABW5RFK8_9BACL